MAKALSHSELRAFLKDRERWYSTYIEGKEEPPSPEALLGRIIHEALEKGSPYNWQKHLEDAGLSHKIEIVRLLLGKMALKRLQSKEQTMSATLFIKRIKKPIQLLGIIDGLDLQNRILG